MPDLSTTHRAPANSPATSKARTGWRAHFPNVLTILRLAIAAAFFVLLSVWQYPARDLVRDINPREPVAPYLVAALLFGLAAVTDAIDGPLARRWKVVSKFGRIMDPFADKVLVIGGLIILAGPQFNALMPDGSDLHVSGIRPWMVVVVLGRELLVTSIRAVLESDGIDFSANWFGKVKMILQACVIPAILLILGITEITKGTWGRITIDTMAWTTVVVTVLSGVPYVVNGYAAMKRAKSIAE